MTPKQVINKEYGEGKNFMTPYILKTAWLIKNKAVYEISEGTGFNHDPIYGVTIVEVNEQEDTTRKEALSDCFKTIGQANYHIKLCRVIINRLAYLREQIKKECISYGEISELESMKKYIDKDDIELMEWIRLEE